MSNHDDDNANGPLEWTIVEGTLDAPPDEHERQVDAFVQAAAVFLKQLGPARIRGLWLAVLSWADHDAPDPNAESSGPVQDPSDPWTAPWGGRPERNWSN